MTNIHVILPKNEEDVQRQIDIISYALREGFDLGSRRDHIRALSISLHGMLLDLIKMIGQDTNRALYTCSLNGKRSLEQLLIAYLQNIENIIGLADDSQSRLEANLNLKLSGDRGDQSSRAASDQVAS
ncbi:hypothetical protein [Methylobacterium organophilum]|uniref:hypothetical protein n=1 Tax=Methylobacterium organophilum TaxID=410 RepID=UPI001EE1A4C1|nr:hypothetical protein [Methylobacterium organophilum]